MMARRRYDISKKSRSMLVLDAAGELTAMPLTAAQDRSLDVPVPVSFLAKQTGTPVDVLQREIRSGRLRAVGTVDPQVTWRDFGNWSADRYREGKRLQQITR